MKRKIFTASLAAVMMVASFTSCAASNNETIVTEVEETEQVETVDETEGSSVETTIEETEPSETIEETIVETTEPAETTIVVDPAVIDPDSIFEPFVIPAEDTTYIDKLIDAGIAPEYYRGTYIAFDDNVGEWGSMIIYFVNNNPDPSVQIYDFADMEGDFEDQEFFSIYLESYYRYFDYYENYDGRQAIDLDGDGEISYSEMGICAFFTCGLEWRGFFG